MPVSAHVCCSSPRETRTPSSCTRRLCHRRRKNHITSLRVHRADVVQNELLAEAVLFDHFNGILRQPFQRTKSVNLEALGITSRDLCMLDACFSEDEVWATICDMPLDRLRGRMVSRACSTKGLDPLSRPSMSFGHSMSRVSTSSMTCS